MKKYLENRITALQAEITKKQNHNPQAGQIGNSTVRELGYILERRYRIDECQRLLLTCKKLKTF